MLSKAVGDTLDSMYTAELPRSVHVRDHMTKLMKKNYRKKASENCECPRCPPQATRVPVLPTTATQDQWKEFMYETVLQTGIHSCSFHCRKPPGGRHGCKGAKPSGLSEHTGPYQLIPNESEEDCSEENEAEDQSIPATSKSKKEKVPVPETKEVIDPPPRTKLRDTTKHPVPMLDERIIVWELKRPLLEQLPAIPAFDDIIAPLISLAADPSKHSETDLQQLGRCQTILH